ncbi:zinc finger and SCAN domain-containing protein 2-like [Hippocampus comes]|uniref:zinc finger and SCAN domain-containing protein 2-like n=1 Tax=Hippocampus comes TaxID=109280 RepID=UPI00094EB8B4|nr:PREDICTED: zinc finger and SCAN domain-containing protein 2-like [Hippocampus comes]
MCKVEMLKALLNQRLSAAVDEIFGVFARTIAEYEEELCRTKEENVRQRQMLDAVFRPQAELLAADVGEEAVPSAQQEWSSTVDQQDPEVVHVKEEAEEADIGKLPSAGVPFKSEDEEEQSQLLPHQSEHSRWMQPPSSNSSQCAATEGDGGHRGESQADNFFAPPSEHHDKRTSHSPGDAAWHADHTYFKCSHCDKTFGTKYTLTRHMKSHTAGKKHWKCSQCGRTLGDRRNLRRHMMVHTGEKPFMCSICGKRFSQKANLITHTRTHTGEKPFSCTLCSKRFGDRSALIQHKKTHAAGKHFACSVYNPSFGVHSNLGQHMRTHTGQKPSA